MNKDNSLAMLLKPNPKPAVKKTHPDLLELVAMQHYGGYAEKEGDGVQIPPGTHRRFGHVKAFEGCLHRLDFFRVWTNIIIIVLL